MRELDLPQGGDIGGLVAAPPRLRALPLDADDGGDDGRLRVEVGPLPLDHHPLRPLRYRLRTLQGPSSCCDTRYDMRKELCSSPLPSPCPNFGLEFSPNAPTNTSSFVPIPPPIALSAAAV